MSKLSDELSELDKNIHEPARLIILTALAPVESVDFVFLQKLTGLTFGNLSGHLTKLESAELITLNKQIVDKRPNTTVHITEKGRQAIEEHWKRLEALHKTATHSTSSKSS